MNKSDLKGLWIPSEILINDNKIIFSFYNNSLLDLLQICYNKTNDTIELEFRDVMGEYLEELKEIIDKK